MKLKLLAVFNIIILIAMPIVLFYQINIAEETNWRLVGKATKLFIVYALAMFGIIRKRSPFDYKVYEVKYKDIIRDAFKNDRNNYMRLMRVIRLMNDNKYKAAIKLLENLKGECVSYQDTSAVLMFLATCYVNKKDNDKAMEIYREVVKIDVANSMAWFNMGALYQENENLEQAFEAYQNAVNYNNDDAYAHVAIAECYLEKENPHKAIEHSLKALELDKKMKNAMAMAMCGYALLGDRQNAEKYYKMYGKLGKDSKIIRKEMEQILAVTSKV